MSTALVLMTALPPTEGHLSLIRFASSFMRAEGGEVLVLMGILPDEPPGRAEHRDALWSALTLHERQNVRIEIQFSNDPQSPRDANDDEFWAHWSKVISRQMWGRTPNYIISSEEYGPRLAQAIGAIHIPFDTARATLGIRATSVRADPIGEFSQIIAPLRDKLRRRVVMFGQESCGKTTLAATLAKRFNSIWVPEWARPYLESLPSPEVTHDRMDTIVMGQHAAEVTAIKLAESQKTPFVFFDTDLLSTIGYDRFWQTKLQNRRGGNRYDSEKYDRRQLLLSTLFDPADLYVVCSDKMPFVPDPLRYGGDRRETSREYWIGLLEEYHLTYCVLPSADPEVNIEYASMVIKSMFNQRCGFAEYVRPK